MDNMANDAFKVAIFQTVPYIPQVTTLICYNLKNTRASAFLVT
jgi:hypothetical protein